MGAMLQELHNIEKYLEYYASKLHQVEKRVEVINLYDLYLTLILRFNLEVWDTYEGSSKSWKHNIYASSHYSNNFLYPR